MPQTKKYLDFVASAPYERGSKHGGPDARRSYVTIACPHCDAAFVEIAADRLHTNKASECLKHLRVCDAAIGAGVLAPPAKRRAGAEVEGRSRGDWSAPRSSGSSCSGSRRSMTCRRP